MFTQDPSLQELIKKACRGKSNIKLTIATYKDGHKTIKVFGPKGIIPSENYIYEIGSITKTFTASLLAKNIHNGLISLDDPISKYIDGLDKKAYYPTLKQLATHTAGYPSYLPLSLWVGIKTMINMIVLRRSLNGGALPFSLDEKRMKELLGEYKVKNKEYKWEYSNFGIALLGYAVGKASGKDYWSLMDEFLSKDLGLTSSYTGTRLGKNLQGFDKDNNNIGNWVWGKDLTAPAGDISSTANDLLTYAHINMYEELPYLHLCHKKYASAKSHDMGLGWILLKKDNNDILFHNGGTSAFRSSLMIDKEKKLASVVLSNYNFDTDKIGMALLEYLQK